jgi:hypothetical protein
MDASLRKCGEEVFQLFSHCAGFQKFKLVVGENTLKKSRNIHVP